MTFSQNKLIYIAGGLVLVTFFLVTFLFLRRGIGPTGGGQRVNLEFWGTFDTTDDFKQSMKDYEALHPQIRISYRQFNFEDYERALINAFASGVGPDAFMIHNTWLPRFQDKISPLPQQKAPGDDAPLFTLKDFRDQFVDVTENDLVISNEIYALPLYVDTLALYYNKDIFNTIGIAEPPKNWDEFNEDVERITISDTNNNISRAGAAMGTARNINRSTDILSLLMLQSGVPMVSDDYAEADLSKTVKGRDLGQVALQYYTDFANPAKRVYTWNNGLHYSIDAFQEGTLGMMFNYAHQMATLKARSVRLNFAVAAMPQLDPGNAVNYANYWAPTVSKFSNNTRAAWELLVYLSSNDGVIPYLNSTSHPTARRELVEEQGGELELGVFAKQVLTAKSWYQVDNIETEKIMADMIEDVDFGRQTISAALRAAEDKITLLMQR